MPKRATSTSFKPGDPRPPGAGIKKGQRTKPTLIKLAAQAEQWAKVKMDAQEAAARIAMDARADIRGLYRDDGRLKPMNEWPDDVVNSIESLEFNPETGIAKIKLVSKLRARLAILELLGVLDGGLAPAPPVPPIVNFHFGTAPQPQQLPAGSQALTITVPAKPDEPR